LLHLRVRTWN